MRATDRGCLPWSADAALYSHIIAQFLHISTARPLEEVRVHFDLIVDSKLPLYSVT